MRSGDLRDGQAVEAAAQILDGLAHAHGRGIIHRDVKPSNVLLAEGDGISVRLLDFGLAQFDEAETLTAVGDVPGTLAYISPERLRGEEACPASDIWGVGILLWEALAGKHPFWGVPLQQMAGTIETGAPPLQVERPDLPKRLLSAIGHALANDPRKRPPAAALAKELRSALGDRRRVVQRVHVDVTRTSLAERGLPAAAAFAATLAGATMLPFFPAFWAPAFALAVGGLTLRVPRAGLALALAAPILPLGNVALGLALALQRDRARLAGSLAGETRAAGSRFSPARCSPPLGLIALVPLAVQPVRGQSAAELRRSRRSPSPRSSPGYGVASSRSGKALPGSSTLAEPRASSTRRSRSRAQYPSASSSGAAALAAIAACSSRTPAHRGGSPVSAAAALALTLLAVPTAPALPLVVAIWLTCARSRSSSRALELRAGGNTPPCLHERPPHHRTEDRRPLRGDVRSCLQDTRAAGRARAKAGEGDGRAPHDLGLARLRPERVLRLPLRGRPRAVHGLRGLADRGAAGLPRRARPARELRDADAAEGADEDRCRSLDRRVRDRDADGAARRAGAARSSTRPRRRSSRARR